MIRSRDQTLPGPATFFMELDHEVFSMIIFSLMLIQEGQLSVSGKKCAQILVNSFVGLSLPRKRGPYALKANFHMLPFMISYLKYLDKQT